MGLEWESGGVPDELLDKHTLLSNALKEDLLFAASKHDDYHNIISISKCGFSALHNVIRLACPIIKEKVPNGFLLTYSDANDITVHVKRIHEYILQCTYVGIVITPFQQWQYIIKGLPHVVRSMLETSASNEIALAGYDREKNLPFNLRIENAASFILSEVMNKGMKKHIVPPKRSKIVDHAQILKFFAKTKRCFYCQKEHLAQDCPTYHLVSKKTGEKKVFVKRTPRQTTAGIGIDATSDDEDIPSHDLDAQDTDSDKEIENDDEMDQLISMVHIANEQSDEEDDAIHQTISSMHHIGDQYNATENIDFDDLNFA
jgi:hypothetical protein